MKVKNMTTNQPSQELPNPVILDVAHSYFDCGKKLYDEMVNEPAQGLYFPSVNLLCHSIELFLKAMSNPIDWEQNGSVYMGFTTKPKNGHNLMAAFSFIDCSFKKTIISRKCSLVADLERLEGVFQASRYPFEKENEKKFGDRIHVLAFETAAFLRDEIENLNPIFLDKCFSEQ